MAPSLPNNTGRLVAAGAAILVVGVLVGVLIGASGDSTARGSRLGEIVDVSGTVDAFDRPNDPATLGASPEGILWSGEAGQWGITDRKAAVTTPASGRSLAVTPLEGGDGLAAVRLDKVTDGAGLVFRYRDPLNYWSIVAAPHFATWSVTKTVKGLSTTPTAIGLSSTKDGTTIGVRMKGDTIDVLIGGQVRKTFIDTALDKERMVGMTAAGPDSAAARFDDFRAALPGDRPLAPPTTGALPGTTTTSAPPAPTAPPTTGGPAPTTVGPASTVPDTTPATEAPAPPSTGSPTRRRS